MKTSYDINEGLITLEMDVMQCEYLAAFVWNTVKDFDPSHPLLDQLNGIINEYYCEMAEQDELKEGDEEDDF